MVYKPVYLNMYYCCCILHLSQCGVDATKRGGLRPCIKSHGHYIVNHGIVFLSFSGNPVSGEKHHIMIFFKIVQMIARRLKIRVLTRFV